MNSGASSSFQHLGENSEKCKIRVLQNVCIPKLVTENSDVLSQRSRNFQGMVKDMILNNAKQQLIHHQNQSSNLEQFLIFKSDCINQDLNINKSSQNELSNLDGEIENQNLDVEMHHENLDLEVENQNLDQETWHENLDVEMENLDAEMQYENLNQDLQNLDLELDGSDLEIQTEDLLELVQNNDYLGLYTPEKSPNSFLNVQFKPELVTSCQFYNKNQYKNNFTDDDESIACGQNSENILLRSQFSNISQNNSFPPSGVIPTFKPFVQPSCATNDFYSSIGIQTDLNSSADKEIQTEKILNSKLVLDKSFIFKKKFKSKQNLKTIAKAKSLGFCLNNLMNIRPRPWINDEEGELWNRIKIVFGEMLETL